MVGNHHNRHQSDIAITYEKERKRKGKQIEFPNSNSGSSMQKLAVSRRGRNRILLVGGGRGDRKEALLWMMVPDRSPATTSGLRRGAASHGHG